VSKETTTSVFGSTRQQGDNFQILAKLFVPWWVQPTARMNIAHARKAYFGKMLFDFDVLPSAVLVCGLWYCTESMDSTHWTHSSLCLPYTHPSYSLLFSIPSSMKMNAFWHRYLYCRCNPFIYSASFLMDGFHCSIRNSDMWEILRSIRLVLTRRLSGSGVAPTN
jgi:hypothetical protein